MPIVKIASEVSDMGLHGGYFAGEFAGQRITPRKKSMS
jgi:hypothetical protein